MYVKFTLQVASLKTWRLNQEQVKKTDLVKLDTSLDTSIYRDLMKNSWHMLDIYRSIELMDFKI